VISFPEKRGKGAAVRAGISAATGSVIVHRDADLATDLSALEVVLIALEEVDIVVGSRAVPGAVLHDTTPGRAVMGRRFNRMVRILTRVEVRAALDLVRIVARARPVQIHARAGELG